MEVIYSKEKQISLKESILTVGSYDGIHVGHRELLYCLYKILKIMEYLRSGDIRSSPKEVLNES